jgi:hypothetical protein
VKPPQWKGSFIYNSNICKTELLSRTKVRGKCHHLSILLALVCDWFYCYIKYNNPSLGPIEVRGPIRILCTKNVKMCYGWNAFVLDEIR